MTKGMLICILPLLFLHLPRSMFVRLTIEDVKETFEKKIEN